MLAISHCEERRAAPKSKQWWQFYNFFRIFLQMSSQINGSGPLIRELVSEINKFTEQIRLYEDFMYMMQIDI